MAAVRVPAAPGVKVTVNVVLPPAATDVAGVLTVKSAGLVPSLVRERPESVAVPTFRMVNVMAVAAVPTLEPPQSMGAALPSVRLLPAGCSTAISGTAPPEPVRLMSNGFSFASLLARWMAAVRTPVAPGAKVTVKVVLPPAATELAIVPTV